MSVMKASWTTWHPKTRQDRDAVMLELEEVLASPHFCNSKRYPALLRYVVERSLAGEANQLKERTLGVDVFHRPPDYDTHSDTVVRYTAGEVRKRLLLYYHDHESPLQISLPAGSYAPEFLAPSDDEPGHDRSIGSDTAAPLELSARPPHYPVLAARPPAARLTRLVIPAVVFVALLISIGVWRYVVAHRQTALEEFWSPMLHQPKPALLCSGGTVFAANYSGTRTAGRDTDYPFVSMQVASAIAGISGQLERNGTTVQIQPASTTPLTDLRERPVVLIGGYNNEWTLRLLSSLRYGFAAEPAPGIFDRDHLDQGWRRDRNQPYASADDYALIVRFRDAITGSIIVVAAGLGRNGTEAAAQFLTSPYYMNLLRQRTNDNLANKNIEAVLKINVIEGKTGAPTIEAVYAW